MTLRSIAAGLILTLSIAGVALAQEPQAAAQPEVKAPVPVATVATTATTRGARYSERWKNTASSSRATHVGAE